MGLSRSPTGDCLRLLSVKPGNTDDYSEFMHLTKLAPDAETVAFLSGFNSELADADGVVWDAEAAHHRFDKMKAAAVSGSRLRRKRKSKHGTSKSAQKRTRN